MCRQADSHSTAQANSCGIEDRNGGSMHCSACCEVSLLCERKKTTAALLLLITWCDRDGRRGPLVLEVADTRTAGASPLTDLHREMLSSLCIRHNVSDCLIPSCRRLILKMSYDSTWACARTHLNHALRLLVRVRSVLPVRVFGSEGARLHHTSHAHGQPLYGRSLSLRDKGDPGQRLDNRHARGDCNGEPAAPAAATRSIRSSSCR